MGDEFQVSLVLGSPDATVALAQGLAPLLHAGDTLLLYGEIGAGKSHFARSVIRHRLDAAGIFGEDIPSPTFTLVQTYSDGKTEIWHADLYRLAGPEDIEELGLLDAFSNSICLIEWPEVLGNLAPRDALKFHITDGPDENTRNITISSQSDRWKGVFSPEFLEQFS